MAASTSAAAGIAPVALAAVLWGTTGTAASFAPAGASALAIGAGTMGLGGMLLALASLSGVRALWRAAGAARKTVLVGGAAVAIHPLAFYASIVRAGVGIGTMIALGSAPVSALALERVLDGARPPRRVLAAVGVSVAGGAIVALSGASGGERGAMLAGMALALISGVTYAVYTHAAARLIAGGAETQATIGLLFGAGALVLLPILVLTGGPLLNGRGALLLAYLALVPVALAYVLFAHGLRHLTASAATTVSLIEPVVAALLSVTVLGERHGAVVWAGVVLVLAGLALLATARGDATAPLAGPVPRPNAGAIDPHVQEGHARLD